MIGIAEVGTITHQPADFGDFTLRIGRGEPVECRKLGELDMAAGKVGSLPDEEGIVPLARDGFESGFDLPAGVGVEDLDLQSHGARSRWRVSFHGLGIRSTRRIDEDSDAGGSG